MKYTDLKKNNNTILMQVNKYFFFFCKVLALAQHIEFVCHQTAVGPCTAE